MPSNRPLTEKQKNFCRAIVAGNTTKDAYKSAYNTKCKDTTAYSEATKLLSDERIQEYITTISKPIEQLVIANNISARDTQISFIKERIEICKTNEDESNIVKYTDMLNKIYGIYKEVDTSKQEQTAVQNLDTESLIKLIS